MTNVSDAQRFYIGGRAYVTGAHAIVKSADVRARHTNDVRFIVSCMMLLGHALELYLKAWLSAAGISNETLSKRPYGHNLRSLYEKARETGLSEVDLGEDQTFADLMETFEVDHGGYLFRYLSPDWTFAPPQLPIVSRLFDELDRVVGDGVYGGQHVPLDWAVDESEDFRTRA